MDVSRISNLNDFYFFQLIESTKLPWRGTQSLPWNTELKSTKNVPIPDSLFRSLEIYSGEANH